MPSYTIDLAIFRLKLLLSDTHNPIPSELESRFSTTNIYPPFDPNIHNPVDWDQLSLSTDCDEDIHMPLNRKLVEDVESVEMEVRVRDWTRDVARRMWAIEGDEGGGDGDTTTHKNDTAPNRQDSDTNENDLESSPTTVDNKRDYQPDSETEDRSGKRRRSARIAAQHGSSSNT